jgi:Flp pilus assembly protein CpaB
MNAAPPGDRRNGASVLERVAPPAGSTSASHVSLGMAPAARPSRRRRLGRLFTARVLGGLLVMALAFGGFLSLLMTSTPQVMSVVVLTRDLDSGAALSSGDLTLAPAQFGDAQSRLVVQAGQLDRVVGRRLLGPAFRDQVLVWPELGPVDQPELEPGTEAVTVAVRPDTAVSGALRPNDWVRVVATAKGVGSRPESQSRTIMPRARVIAIGRGDQRATSGTALAGGGAQAAVPSTSVRLAQPISTVTLGIPEDQVESVTAAKYSGEIDLVWVGPEATATQVVVGQ